jgi:dihydropteroate synthase
MVAWRDVGGGKAAVMGVLNVTPDSFSDGGRFLDPGAAAAHGVELVAAGAAIVDVGGESTRPGARPVPAADELARVVPVVERLVAEGVTVSVDTSKAAVARAALDAGAVVVNDVTAGRGDRDMLATVAAASAGYVVMHMRGEPRTMQDAPAYDDVVGEVCTFLAERLAAARDAGIADAALCADPGIGFGKRRSDNVALLAQLGVLVDALGVPVMIGTSRKSFLGAILNDASVPGAEVPDGQPREDATLATVTWALDAGARYVRVHDVAPAVDVLRLLQAMAEADAEAAA